MYENYAKTLTDSTFDFSITAEDVRGGFGNALYGRYFHDSNMTVTLVDAMFNLDYFAASFGVDVESGGVSVMEESLTGNAGGGGVTLTETPLAYEGSLIGWYQKPGEDNWTIGTIEGQVMTIPGAQQNETYCVKYFYNNENARSITIKTQYVPSVLHVVIINDLFAGDISNVGESSNKIGRLITDIPRLQMDGNQNLAFTSSSAATINLTGNALAVSTGNTCEEDPYYGTMTEEIFGTKWQDNVIAIAVENSEVELNGAGATEDLIVRVVYGGAMKADRKENSNFTFTMLGDGGTYASVGAHDGKVSAIANGTGYLSVALTDYENVEPAYVQVTVSGVV